MTNVIQLDQRRASVSTRDAFSELKDRVSPSLTPDFLDLKARGLTPVFVYGTLKKGFSNHRFLEKETYLGKATSVASNYTLRDGGSFPYMTIAPYGVTDCGQVSGEVYAVDAFTMAHLDRLEGNGSFYTRTKKFFTLKEQEVLGKNGMILRPTLECWVYLVPHEEYSHVELCPNTMSHNQFLRKDIKVFSWG